MLKAPMFFIVLLGSRTGADAFEFLRCPLAWVDLQRTFGAAKWNVDERALQRHQSGQCLYLFGIGIGCVANTALYRLTMLTVNRAPADEAVHAAAQTNAETDRIRRITLHNPFSQTLRKIKEGHGMAEVPVDAFEEACGTDLHHARLTG